VRLVAMNADGLLGYSQTPPFRDHRDATRVGIWYWEVGVFPEALRPAFELVDQVWCASEHVRTALAGWADGKVRKHPLVIEAPTRPPSLLRADLRLPPDRFLFGFAFDYFSVLRRKNPVGLIEAYRRAFGPEDGAALVLKTINEVRGDDAAAVVRAAAGDRDDIIFFDDHLDDVQMRAFFGLLDCYVSLHRSEGLGLTIASAMASGIPAIATGWSGNLEFMTSENSILVPSELVEVGPGAYPYPIDAWWAEPDLDVAADAMRRLYDDRPMARELGQRGATSVTTNHNIETAAAWFGDEFAALSGDPRT
jgi:glycosyltransferase involved in cell wall biosynthesis